MDEVDIEDADDLNELEARLYAQIHHEPSGDCDFSATYEEASPIRHVTATSVINNRSADRTRAGRYWNEKESPRTSIKSKETFAGVTQSDRQQSTSLAKNGEMNEQPAETGDKSFRSPVKTLSNLRVNPFASGNDPRTKGSSAQMQAKITIASKTKKQNSKEIKGPFVRQIRKLANAVKYDAKKQKAKAAKAKQRKEPITDSIDLLSSNGSDTDDVIEVPLPPPKILTIDSSSDDEEKPIDIEKDFAKPQVSVAKENSSRCTSPCSVVSDDFIGQSDRTRLLEEAERPDDEDLLMLQEDVDSLLEHPESVTDKNPTSFVAPKRGDSSNTPADYRVTQNDFKALDVYESESDIQESVYSKGLKSTKPSLVVRLEHESSSCEDVEEVDVTQKTKRLRKRRASSSNKESETYIDSTDSEQEKQVSVTRIPYIARGEAIKNCIDGEKSQNKKILNSSDNEFIATLNTLAQGTSTSVHDVSSNETDEEGEEQEEEITARAIAENVIQSENRSIESPEPVNVDDEEACDAIPDESVTELSQIFEKIDSIDKNSQQCVSEGDDSNDSVQLVPPLPVSRNIKTIREKKLQNNSGDPVYNIVYCERTTHFGGIGWNEEMRRFYNSSWNGERFSVKAVCSKMKTAKSLWKIYSEDRFPKYQKRSNQACLNCCEFGHVRSRCPKPRKPPVCYMCGEKGHHEPRCPNTVCLRCGNKTRMFTKSCNACNYQNRLVCPICKVRGHNLNLCPDKWRRYHSTTKPNEYPNNRIEYKNRKFCCICGKRGHLADYCRNGLRFLEYPLFISEIRSHQKSYDDLSIRTIRTGIGYNLMYKPEEDLSFELAENKTRQQYYGRFLIAVGMGYLLKRKHKISNPIEEEPAVKQSKVDSELKEYVINPFAKTALDITRLKTITSSGKKTTDNHKKPTNGPPAVLETDSTAVTSTVDDSNLTNKNYVTSSQEIITLDVDDVPEFEPSSSTGSFKEPNAISFSNEASAPNMELNNIPEETCASTFKTPDSGSVCIQAQKNPEVLEVIDSDSNYSFSEHFEQAQETESRTLSRKMDPLPDYIPIADDDDLIQNAEGFKLSKPYVTEDTDDDESSNSGALPAIPCEAKIYLTNFHSKFLLSPNGNQFLIEKSIAFDIKARLDWTSVGHILVIYGLRKNQDKFHTELLHKFRDLSDKMNRKQLENSQKVPKKTDVLIRFLRENINQLHSNLGNVNEMLKRLAYQENQHTKSGWKAAEKTRRSLNMILIGQAGLRNGSMHLDRLLSHLRTLIEDDEVDVVPNEVRDEIDSHWKLIFSSYRHEKYDELVKVYNNMSSKNLLQNLNIDPRLLGKKVIDTSLTKAQKEKMEKAPELKGYASANSDKQNEKQTPTKFVPNPASVKNQTRQTKTPISDKKRPRIDSNSPSVSQPNNKKPQQSNAVANLPAVNKTKTVNTEKQPKQQQVTAVQSPLANKIKAVNKEWETKCVNLLTEIEDTKKMKRGRPVLDSKSASVFWSREAMKYIDECMQLGKSNGGLMEKLTRVQNKSRNGLLSYNDYRAIIKIHNAVKGKH